MSAASSASTSSSSSSSKNPGGLPDYKYVKLDDLLYKMRAQLRYIQTFGQIIINEGGYTRLECLDCTKSCVIKFGKENKMPNNKDCVHVFGSFKTQLTFTEIVVDFYKVDSEQLICRMERLMIKVNSEYWKNTYCVDEPPE